MAVSKATALLAAALTLGSAPPEIQQTPLDPARGQIDGKVALAFLPQEPDGSTARDPARYEVHLADDEDLNIERVIPAATWFQPPPGKYRVWVEGQGRMSPESVVVRYSGSPFQGRGLLGGMQLGPAGKVGLADEARVAGTEVLRLLHLDSHKGRPFPQREISRRVSGEALKSGVLMPAGPILAALFDGKTQEYTGLTRPTVVKAGERTAVRPVPPEKGTTHVIALLERPGAIDSFTKDDVRPILVLAEGPRPPDVIVPTAERIYAVWYGLNARRAKLELTSSYVSLPPQDLVLRPGRIERLSLRMNRRPDLQVTLQFPDEASLEGSSLEIVAVATAAVAAQAKIDPAKRVYRFENLPPELLEVRLKTPVGVFRERADLSSGRDAEAVLEANPVILRGTVYRNRDPHPARIAFHVGAGGDAVEVETDAQGAYEAVLLRRVLIARVQLAGAQGPPHLEFFNNPIEESSIVDFHVAANEGKVSVLDAETGRGIPAATVVVRSSTTEGKVFEQSSTAGQDGIAALPPLRDGDVAIEASADGYLPSSEPVRFAVRTGEAVPDSKIVLRRTSAGQTLHLVTSAGAAAGSAELLASRSPVALDAVWRGHADGDGKVELPREAEGAYLLIRHAGSGFLVRRWQPGDPGNEEALWQLPPRATPPLTVRVFDSSGSSVAWANLSLWIDGLQLDSSALGWLTGMPPFTNRDGVWTAANLPSRPLEILAWRGDDRAQAAGMPVRSLATEIHPPVREPVALQILDF